MELDCSSDRSVCDTASTESSQLTEFEAVQIRSDLGTEFRTLIDAVNNAVGALQPREDALEQTLLGQAELLVEMSPDAWRALARENPAYDVLHDAVRQLEDFMQQDFPLLEAAHQVDSQSFVGSSEVSLMRGNANSALSNASEYGRKDTTSWVPDVPGMVGATDQALTGIDMMSSLQGLPTSAAFDAVATRVGVAASGFGMIEDISQINAQGMTPSAGFSLAANAGGLAAGAAALAGGSVPFLGGAVIAAEVISGVLEHQEQAAMLKEVTYDTLARAGMPDALATRFSESRLDGIMALREAGIGNEQIYEMAWEDSSILKTPGDVLAPLIEVLSQQPAALLETLKIAGTEAFPAGNIAHGLLAEGTPPASASEFADALQKFDAQAFVFIESALITHLRSLD